MDLSRLRAALAQQQIDAWVIYDFRGSSAVLPRVLPPEGPAAHGANSANSATGQPARWTTRRLALVVPRVGPATLLVNPLDAGQFASLPALRDGTVLERRYVAWTAFRDELACLLAGTRRVAMEYSPGAALPAVGTVDAGTIELVRALGVEVVSSADLIQATAAAWGGPSTLATHQRTSALVDAIKDEAFARVGAAVRAGATIFEHEVAAFIRERFAAHGLHSDDGPVVAVNAHAADPHYLPAPEHPMPIRAGDWLLIDLWARPGGAGAEREIFGDITWVASVGGPARALHARVFGVVAAARDAALDRARAAWAAGERVEGWQLDEAARRVITDAGLAHGLRHRTGHSLSPGPLVHGLGMNLDALETRDSRAMLPDTGFTIEPGVYLPDERDPAGGPTGLGVRLEINVYVDPALGPVVTSGVQREIIIAG